MYTEFFELIEKPFSLSTSPRFLYLGEKHREALAILRYGVMERQGFVLLTGEVGTGKTTMVRALLSSLDANVVKYVHLANPLLSPKEFISYLILSAFDNRLHFKSKPEFLIAFEAFLTKIQQRNRHFLLVIDEAHKLSFDLLEEIRLLSNLETAEEKLISIFLVGQPELNERLSEPRCRPLLQRISVRYHIPPLNLEETREYVTTRLEKAGSKRAREIFSGKAIHAIHEYSHGYPRMINILADNALLLGYSKGESKISPAMIKSCYQDLRLGPSEGKADTVKGVAGREPVSGERSVRPWWKWAAVFLLIAGILAFVAIRYGDQILSRWVSASAEVPEAKVDAARPSTPAAEKELPVRQDKPPVKQEAPAVATALQSAPAPVEEKIEVHLEEKKTAVSSPAQESEVFSEVHPRDDGKMIVVERGDTLGKLSSRVYGRTNDRLIDLIQKSNPRITDPDLILPGQKVIFPPVPESPH